MKKSISLLALASILAAGTAYGSGYRIPEQSADSVAKAGAHIASSTGADSSFYNPANMGFAEDAWLTEIDLTYIHLTSIDYTDARTPGFNGSSEQENFLLPTFFVVSPDYNSFRFGLSFTVPYGLAKQWKDPYPALFARKFELEVFDLNPTVAYKVNDFFSLAGGVRMIVSTAQGEFGGTRPDTGVSYDVNLDGDYGVDWGWNVALAAKPSQNSNLTATYRSLVDLDLSGDVTASLMGMPFDTGGNVDLPAPAVFTLAGAYTWNDLTIELAWDRTFWSEYEEFNLEFDDPTLEGALGAAQQRNWDDTDAFRISASYAFNDAFTGMLGFAVDSNPVPDETIGFQLPDSDPLLFSIGGRYNINERASFGLGFLYDYKESRTANNREAVGEFENAAAFLLSAGFSYKF
jgi:long-chain fatty acid transport protein